jgi:hypothetical protein
LKVQEQVTDYNEIRPHKALIYLRPKKSIVTNLFIIKTLFLRGPNYKETYKNTISVTKQLIRR